MGGTYGYTPIVNLPRIDTLQSGDVFPVYDISNSDARGVALSILLQYMQDNITATSSGVFTTQYSSPLDATTVQINDNGNNTHLILSPLSGLTSLILKLPAVANLVDKQEIIVNSIRQITNLTVDANGATTVYGAPSSMGADDFFRLKYDEPFKNWYRIG